MNFSCCDELCLRCFAALELEETFGFAIQNTKVFRDLQAVSINSNSKDQSTLNDHCDFGNCLYGLASFAIPITQLQSAPNNTEEAKPSEMIVEPPILVHKICTFLCKHLHVGGLFRISGSWKRIAALKERLQNDDFQLTDEHPHDVANILTQFLRQLSVHIIPKCLNIIILQIMQLHYNDAKLLAAVQLLSLMLPASHLHTLVYIMHFFSKVAAHCDANKMPSSCLATVLTPNILELDLKGMTVEGSRSAMTKLSRFVQLLIQHPTVIGKVTQTLKGKVCQIGQCSHSKEWFAMGEFIAHANEFKGNKSEQRVKSLAGRIYETVCGKQARSGEISSSYRTGSKDGNHLKKQCLKRPFHQDSSTGDNIQPIKRRSLQGTVENMKLTPYLFKDLPNKPPKIDFIPADAESYVPVVKTERHDSGNTSCFGTRAKGKRKSLRNAKNTQTYPFRISYPITSVPKTDGSPINQSSFNQKSSIQTDSAPSKSKKNSLLWKLKSLTPSIRKKSKAKRRALYENRSMVLLKAKEDLSRGSKMSLENIKTTDTNISPTNKSSLNPNSYASTAALSDHFLMKAQSMDVSKLDESITIFDLSMDDMVSRYEGCCGEDRYKSNIIPLNSTNDEGIDSKGFEVGRAFDISPIKNSTSKPYHLVNCNTTNEQMVLTDDEGLCGRAEVESDPCQDDTSDSVGVTAVSSVKTEESPQVNFTEDNAKPRDSLQCSRISSALNATSVATSLLYEENAICGNVEEHSPKFVDDLSRVANKSESHAETNTLTCDDATCNLITSMDLKFLEEECQSSLEFIIEEVVKASTMNESSEAFVRTSTSELPEIKDVAKISLQSQFRADSPGIKCSKVILLEEGKISSGDVVLMKASHREDEDVENMSPKNASNDPDAATFQPLPLSPTRLLSKVSPKIFSKISVRGPPPPVPIRTSSIQRPRTIVEEMNARCLNERCIRTMHPVTGVQESCGDDTNATESCAMQTDRFRLRSTSSDFSFRLNAAQKIKLFEEHKIQKRSRSRIPAKVSCLKTGKVQATVHHFDRIEPGNHEERLKLSPLPCKETKTEMSIHDNLSASGLQQHPVALSSCDFSTSSFDVSKVEKVVSGKSDNSSEKSKLKTDQSAISGNIQIPRVPSMKNALFHIHEGITLAKKYKRKHKKSNSLDGHLNNTFSPTSPIKKDVFHSPEAGQRIKNRVKTPVRHQSINRRGWKYLQPLAPLVLQNFNVGQDTLDCSPVKRAIPKEPRSRHPVGPVAPGSKLS